MKNDIVNKVSGIFYSVGFKLKKHSPEILMAVGVVGTVASAVMACKATTKLGDILDDTSDKLDKIHECVETEDFADEYTIEDSKKDTAIVYVQTGVKIVKLYAPAVGLGILSLSGIITSNNILRKRNIALAAAYATVDNSYKQYRNRVIERFGEEIDKQLKYNIKAETVKETITDENGKEVEVTKTVGTIDPNEFYSDYARFFDASSPHWDKEPSYNLMFLKRVQAYANEKLRVKGYMFLNEVYEMLGLEPSKAGQVVGWMYDEENPVGDNYIDFGIYEPNDVSKRRFVNGLENVIILDFNVDGNIWNLM